eukprot:TRINITY_DN18487_c0_g1_i1.p1 TRINITY_DN18487_c0_g1~~TRINITY_DN18487_c0_g1_i1.p1  ORF type:complete len:294 (+),score=6.18 TRINITY_DN18487_c0_g1_i1:138-1019(+)
MASTASLASHHHGKSKVRLGRVWRRGPVHSIVEWTVEIVLKSDAERSFTSDDCSSVVATDTMKNTVYVIAKKCNQEISPEEFAIRLGEHFVFLYPMVTGASIRVEEKPWGRVEVAGEKHEHGFALGRGTRVAAVDVDAMGRHVVRAGVADWSVLKTTASGFEGFVRDENTLLPDTRERILATTVEATWSYSTDPPCFTAAFAAAKAALADTFYGPSKGGVYSPSVQRTLFLMGQALLDRVPQASEVQLKLPNLHFIPVNMPGINLKFDNDVYLPTSEPHGTIAATVQRTPSRL